MLKRKALNAKLNMCALFSVFLFFIKQFLHLNLNVVYFVNIYIKKNKLIFVHFIEQLFVAENFQMNNIYIVCETFFF